MAILGRKEYLKKMEAKRKKSNRRVKKFRDFKKKNPNPFEFKSVASTAIPGPLSIVTTPANIS